MKLIDLPLEIVEVVKRESQSQGKIAIPSADLELRDEALMVWANTEHGYKFWEKIESGDFSEFYSLYPSKETVSNSQKSEIMNQPAQKLSLVGQLQDLEASGKVRVIVERIFETHYKTKDLDKALEKQVVMNIIHTIPAMEFIATVVDNDGDASVDGFQIPNVEDVEIQQPRVLIDLHIIGLDTTETIQKKIDIAKRKLAEMSEIDRIIALRNSDNLLDCMEGYFGEGNRIEIQARNN